MVTAGNLGTGSKETARELAINSGGTGDAFSLLCTLCVVLAQTLRSPHQPALMSQDKQEMEGKVFRRAQQP